MHLMIHLQSKCGREIGIGTMADGVVKKKKMATFDPLNHTSNHAFKMHNQRQNSFYTACLRKLRRDVPNITWVMIVDTDEYFTYNSILPVERSTPTTTTTTNNNETNFPTIRADLPKTIGRQNETIAHYIAEHYYNTNTTKNENNNNKKRRISGSSKTDLDPDRTLCMVYPRLDFSGRDSVPDNNNNNNNNNENNNNNNNIIINNKSNMPTSSSPSPLRTRILKEEREQDDNNNSTTTPTNTNAKPAPIIVQTPTRRTKRPQIVPDNIPSVVLQEPILPSADNDDHPHDYRFDVQQFHTLRFRYHSTYQSNKMPGKSLVNVKRYNGYFKVENPHRPFAGHCSNEAFPRLVPKATTRRNRGSFEQQQQPQQENEDYPFRVHHYSGSLETFLSRPERDVAAWEHKNKFEIMTVRQDDSMAVWMNEFIKLVGSHDKAYELTQGARETAYQEALELKEQVMMTAKLKNESISIPHNILLFEWDQPRQQR